MMNDMSSMYGSEDILLFGGNLLGDSLPFLALDEGLDVKQVDEATLMQTAPCGGEFVTNDYAYALPSPSADWMSEKVDLSDFDADFIGLFEAAKDRVDVSLNNELGKGPASPAESYDSGVASPGITLSNLETEVCASPPTDIAIYDNTPDDVASFLYQSSPVSSSDAACNVVARSMLPHLEVDFAANGSPLFNIELSAPPKVPLVANSNPTELQMLLSSYTDSIEPQQREVVDNITPIPKSKPGRKNKVTSVQERKQRKRDQNKNAATRYRERKRQEQMEKKGEESKLLDRNRTLNDKVNQISREIDYLKELMIEVYRIKGVIQ
uniref:ATF4/5 transcription factor protein n=1 Tax=Phallusia mammillata TaxID=59560 RepID=A0A6F9D7K5_9ASCI|nr:ATF4/5 transcription factor protein [Phallusia mammillata]